MPESAEARAARRVTPALIDAYQRDGAVCIRGLFSPAEIALAQDGIDANLADPSPRAIVASRPGDPGFFIEDFRCWQRIAQYRRLIEESPAAAAAGRLMRSATARLYHDHMLTKEPNTAQKTPWHQDQPYYNVEGMQNASMWLPVDPVPRDSTLEFLAGSHRGPWLMPRSFMTNEARWFPEGSLADLPDIEADRAAFNIIGWALEPGDVVFFHMLALHAAGGMKAGRRRVLSVRFLGEDMRHAPRAWKTSPEFPGLIDELPAGAPMEHKLFPVLWRQGGAKPRR